MSIHERLSCICRERPAQTRDSGFTLVEVVVGMGIFVLAMVSFFQAFSQGFMILESARDLNRVTQAMQTQVENLRGGIWSDFEQQVGTIKINGTGITLGSFNLEQSIVPDNSGDYKVSIVATWTDRWGRNHSETFLTWFSQNGLNNYYTRST